MRRVNGLKVIENPYCYVGWETVRTEAGQCFHSQKKTFCQRRDTELYRLCGVYHRAGVPAEIEEVDGGGAEEEFCLRVTRNLSDSVYRGVKAGKAVLIAGDTAITRRRRQEVFNGRWERKSGSAQYGLMPIPIIRLRKHVIHCVWWHFP